MECSMEENLRKTNSERSRIRFGVSKLMKTTLRIICGIIGFPVVVVCAIAMFIIVLAISIALSAIGLMVWIPFAAIASLFGCAEFALDDNTSIFKCIGEHFVLAFDWHNGWADIIIPAIVMAYESVEMAYKGIIDILCTTKDAWKSYKVDNAMKCKDEDKQ